MDEPEHDTGGISEVLRVPLRHQGKQPGGNGGVGREGGGGRAGGLREGKRHSGPRLQFRTLSRLDAFVDPFTIASPHNRRAGNVSNGNPGHLKAFMRRRHQHSMVMMA